MSALKETKPENKEALNNIPDNINGIARPNE